MKCSVCGCENEENVTLCPQCGSESTAPADRVLCRHCGKQIRPTAKFCVYCGGRQAEEIPVPDPEPAEEVPVAPEPVEEAVLEAPAAAEPAAEAPEPKIVCVTAPAPAPARKLPTGRGLAKMFFLGILTCMLYPFVILSRMVEEINMVASRHDGKRTMQLIFVPILTVLTLGIYGFVWCHRLCDRMGNELRRRGICYRFGAGSFWLWNFLWGILGAVVTVILGGALVHLHILDANLANAITAACALVSSIGPFVFVHKMMRAMNLINADYNEKG